MGQTMRVFCSSLCAALLWLASQSVASAKPFGYPVSPEEQLPNKQPIGVFTDAAINPSTGVYSTSFPIQLPPGKNGLTPSLALVYTSTQWRSTIGIGWDFPLDHVRRSLRHGTPKYVGPAGADADDQLEFRLGQYTGTLVYVMVENGLLLYRPKIEGAFAKFYYSTSGDSWIVQDRSGNTWYLGEGANDDDPAAAHRTFAWYVKRVVDSLHNRIEYSYLHSDGNLYLTKVDYDLPETGLPTNHSPHVELIYEADVLPTVPSAITYRKGWRSELDRRFLRRIEVHAFNEQQQESIRQYRLEPDVEQPGGQMIVRSFDPDALPTATFHYHSPTFNLYTVRDLANTAPSPDIPENRALEVTCQWPGTDDDTKYATTAMLVDIDGDGDLDQLRRIPPSGQPDWRKNTGWGFDSGSGLGCDPVLGEHADTEKFSNFDRLSEGLS